MTLSKEAEVVLSLIGNGDLDVYDVYSNPKGEAQHDAALEIERQLAKVQEGTRLHPDDDFETLMDRVCDNLAHDYPVEEPVRLQKISSRPAFI